MKKRILSVLLTLVLIAGLIPVSAIQASAVVIPHVAVVETESGTEYFSVLTDAFAAAKQSENAVLRLLDDISLDEYIMIDCGKFTIDLNGRTVSIDSLIAFYGTADVKIMDTAGGAVLTRNADISTIVLYDTAKLEIAGGTIEHTGGLSAIAMDMSGNASSSELTVSGGTIRSSGSTAITALGSSITVTGGTIECALGGIAFRTGTIDLSGHPDPAGITIRNYTDEDITVGGERFKIPAGYVMQDENGVECAVLESSGTYTAYTVSKAQAAPEVSADSAKIAVVDIDNGTEIEGATVNLLDSEGNLMIEWISSETVCEITDLQSGEEYCLRVTVAPEGYEIPSDIWFVLDENGDVTCTGTITEDDRILIELNKTSSSSGSSGSSDSSDFSENRVIIGEAENDDWYYSAALPSHTLYENVISQIVIPAADLEKVDGKITDLRWLYFSCMADMEHSVQLYLTEIDADTLTGMIAVDPSALVFDGTVFMEAVDLDVNHVLANPLQSPAFHIALDTPYKYRGGNLLITIVRNSEEWGSSYFLGSSVEGNSSITRAAYLYRDDAPYSLEDIPTDGAGVTLLQDTPFVLLTLIDFVPVEEMTPKALTEAVEELNKLVADNASSLAELGDKLDEVRALLAALDAENRLAEAEAVLKTLAETTLPALSDKLSENESATRVNAEGIAALQESVGTMQTTLGTLSAKDAELAGLITGLESTLADLSNELGDISDRITAAESAIIDLEAAVAELNKLIADGGDIAKINAQLKEIGDAIAALDAGNRLSAAEATLTELVGTTLPALNLLIAGNTAGVEVNAGKIEALQNTVGTVQTALDALSEKDTELAGLITAFDTELDTLSSSLTALEARMTTAEEAIGNLETALKQLEDALSESATVESVNMALKAVEDRLAVIEALNIADRFDATEQVISGLIEMIEQLNTETLTAIEEDVSTNSYEIAVLQDTVSELRQTLGELSAQDTELARLISEVDIELSTLSDALTALETRMKDNEDKLAALRAEVDELNKLIADGGEIEQINAKINAITALINALDDTYATDAAVTDAIEQAKQEVTEAYTEAIRSAVETLSKTLADGDKQNADALTKAIEDLEQLIDAAEEAATSANETLRGDLTKAIADAGTAITDAYKKAIEEAAAELDAAMKQGDADLSAEIASLNTALANAKAALEKADADNKAELVSKIESAQNVLQAAIDAVASDLAAAEQELADAISNGDAILSNRILSVSATLNAAKTALEKADADLRAAMEAKIAAAEATLDAAIKAAQKNLDDAKAELNKAIADGDTALDAKVTTLNDALATAKAALAAADGAVKAELTAKIDEAYASLDAAIKAVQKNLDDLKTALEAKDNELANKDGELQTFIIIVCVIAGAAFCGCAVLAVVFFIDRRRKS